MRTACARSRTCTSIATITKLLQEMLPADIVCSKETRDLLIDCSVGRRLRAAALRDYTYG